ncbi:hypothetical protein PaG_00223 [Moesziomyces aphidis]|uniref:RING-type E3 ubiquitin transferase n=1 Tax=Moesziomyces aphidis TaxID=84754 RepID=W3VWL6_MOEAP|nr:hypothetical protein PaG_00223 [Moesziomyces aphidis]
MSTAQESIPPTRRGGATSSGRRGGGSSSNSSRGGRRANFGGSLTAADANAAPANGNGNSNSSSNRSRPNNSRQPRTKANQAAQGSNSAAPTAAPQPAAASADNTITTTTTTDDDDDEGELPPDVDVCFICADPVKLTSLAPCDHRTCHICALRLLVLYKKDQCTFCKAKIDRLIFTSSPTKNFEDFQPTDIPYSDRKLPISFESKEALEETVLLLRYNCPDPNCEVACTGWRDFKAHVRREHDRLVCQLCITNKKIFAHEHTLHTAQSLAAHEKQEHKLCEYDRTLFYGDDELFAHMRDRHEQCHICKASGTAEERWKYYRDYNMLERHFRNDHWLCENAECLEKKFIVFESEVDFKAHQVQEHGNELSSRERREALRIEANFSYDDSSSEARQGGAGRSGAGRKGKGRAEGTDAGASASENRDVLGVSSLASRAHVPGAGPANHASRRAMFGSGLTTPAPQGVAADRVRTVTDERSIEERHQAYMDKASRVLGGSEARIASFRACVRAFKSGESSARDLISTLHSLVQEMDDCAPLVNGLVDLLDDRDKSKALSDAWAGYRIERTQFPSLTPSGGVGAGVALGSGYAGAGRALKNIKKSSAATSAVWDNVERAASASSGHGAGRPVALREHFPSLGSGSARSTSVPGSLAHAVAHSAATRAAAPSAKWSAASPVVVAPAAKPYVARVHSGGPTRAAVSASAFPSLPTNAAKKAINEQKKSLFNRSPGASGGATPRGSGSGSNTPWIPQPGRIDDGQGLGSLDGLSEALVESQEGAGKKKKGKAKGVQLAAFGGVHRG